MALQTISIHFAVGEVVEPRGRDRIAIGSDVDLFLGFGDAAVRENAVKLIMAAQALIVEGGPDCYCSDPICPEVHPIDRPDAIDEAKRAREIAEEAAWQAEAERRRVERDSASGDEWTNREGMPEFNGSFR